MRIFHAGGSPIVETSMHKPAIMASAYVDAKNGRPNSRLKKLLALRSKDLKKKRKK